MKLRIKDVLDKCNWAAIPTDLFIEIQKAKLVGQEVIEISDSVLLSICKKSILIERKNEAMRKCVELNNYGIEQERNGDICAAIKAYEENTDSSYIICVPFDRLMVLYRKLKDYDNEIRIINKAIDILCTKYPNLKDKYIQRLEKAQKLKSKIKSL